MYKKVFICILALIIAAGLLCGCDGSTTPRSSANVQVTTVTPSSKVDVTTVTPSSKVDFDLGALPYMAQIDGKLFYLDVLLENGVAIEDGQIAGYITASNYEIPDTDGECNFAPVGTPYAPWSTAEYPETYVIYATIANNTGWYLLRPAEG